MLNKYIKQCAVCNKSTLKFLMITKDGNYICNKCKNEIYKYNDKLYSYSIEELKESIKNQTNVENTKHLNSSENSIIENKVISPLLHTKNYKLSGVTFQNEEGKDIQEEIKKILREYVSNGLIEKDDMFCGYTNSDIKDMDIIVSQYEDIPFGCKLKKDTFEDKPCVKVYIKRADDTYTHIGYIPKKNKQIQEVIDILNTYDSITLILYITGGKMKRCRVETDDEYNEKFYVETIDLTYGFELFIE